MEVMLDIKNIPKAMQPTTNDVILFNGKTWYLTTREALLKEAYDLLKECKNNCEKSLNEIKAENNEFKRTTADQMKRLVELVEKLYEGK